MILQDLQYTTLSTPESPLQGRRHSLPDPHPLVHLELSGSRQGETHANCPFANSLRDGASSLLSTGGRGQIISATLVSGNWFETLGVNAAFNHPVVLTLAFSQRRFGSDPAVPGVTQPGFRGTDILSPPGL